MRNSDVLKILDNIKNPSQKRQLQEILTGKIVQRIRCMSSTCNGRIVGIVYSNGDIKPTIEEDGRMFLRATRTRLDGYLGFQCWCGNDSRLCDAEKGVSGIENNAVTKADLETVYERLQKRPVAYPINNGSQRIDNFLIEQI